MPVWTVQNAGGEDELVEAGLLVTESAALVALSEEGLMMRAWAPGQWRTVRYTHGNSPSERTSGTGSVLAGVPSA
jgi:hypothetical protein